MKKQYYYIMSLFFSVIGSSIPHNSMSTANETREFRVISCEIGSACNLAHTMYENPLYGEHVATVQQSTSITRPDQAGRPTSQNMRMSPEYVKSQMPRHTLPVTEQAIQATISESGAAQAVQTAAPQSPYGYGHSYYNKPDYNEPLFRHPQPVSLDTQQPVSPQIRHSQPIQEPQLPIRTTPMGIK